MNNSLKHNIYTVVYIAIIIICAFIIALRLPHIRFEADILSCLPNTTTTRIDKRIIDEYTKRIDSQIVFLVKDTKDSDNALKATNELFESLSEDERIQSIISKNTDDDSKQYNEYLFNKKHALITEKQRLSLTKDNYDKKVLSALFSSFSGVSAAEITSDPLLLTRAVIKALTDGNNIKIKNNFLCVKHNNEDYYLLTATTNSNGYNIKDNEKFCDDLNNLTYSLEEKYQTRILKRGTLFYSNYAANQSKNDISFIGSLSLIGVFSLIFYVFRSFTPVLLALSSVFAGLLCAFSALLLFYDEINIILIGMALSIIGIVCDYTIYYMTLRLKSNDNESPLDTVNILKKPLILAVATDAVAYLIILISPIEPLKQLSLFCMVVITVSCLFVLLVEPFLCKKVKRRELPLTNQLNSYLNFVAVKKHCIYILLILTVICVVTIPFTKINNSPKTFQSMPEFLQNEDNEIAKILNQTQYSTYLIVSAKSEEELLINNEKAKTYLDKLKKEKLIKSYKALPLNSKSTQENDIRLIKDRFVSVANTLGERNIVVNADIYNNLCTVSLTEFTKSKVGQNYQSLLVLDDSKSLYSALIIIEANRDKKSITNLINSNLAQSHIIDRHDDFEKIFTHFSELIIYVLLSFIASIFVISVFRVGFIKAVYTTIFSIISVLIGISSLSIFNYSVNLFNELALILVLGIGVNYTIFFTSYKGDKKTSLCAIITSLLTTLLSVGILSISSVNVIASFAITLSFGIFASFILATLLPGLTKHD